jgi:hypothetical protein
MSFDTKGADKLKHVLPYLTLEELCNVPITTKMKTLQQKELSKRLIDLVNKEEIDQQSLIEISFGEDVSTEVGYELLNLLPKSKIIDMLLEMYPYSESGSRSYIISRELEILEYDWKSVIKSLSNKELCEMVPHISSHIKAKKRFKNRVEPVGARRDRTVYNNGYVRQN